MGTDAVFVKTIAFFRGAVTISLFLLFGAGALLLSALMPILRTPRRCQPLVRATWIPFAALMRLAGIVGVERGNLSPELRGCVIAANHPSLIDVVLVTALVPRTLYVAKPALLRNPFMASIVRHTSLPADERLPEAVSGYLCEGWNVLVFPEGTRSPAEGGLGEFRRGVAQLILRTGAPLVCLGIGVTQRILAKGQKPWCVGAKRVVYSFRADGPTRHVAARPSALRPDAIRLTAEIRRRIEDLVAGKA